MNTFEFAFSIVLKNETGKTCVENARNLKKQCRLMNYWIIMFICQHYVYTVSVMFNLYLFSFYTVLGAIFLSIEICFQGDKLAKQIRQVRYVYFHTILILLFWIPNGVNIFMFKILIRYDENTEHMKKVAPLVALSYAVYFLCPLSYVFLLAKMPVVQVLVPCYRSSN